MVSHPLSMPSEAVRESEVMVGDCCTKTVHTLKNQSASLAQLVVHAFRKRMATGSIPVGGFFDITSITKRSDVPQDGPVPLPGIGTHTRMHTHAHINA